MAELVTQILALPKSERLKIAMQILLSIQEEEKKDDWHMAELARFQQELAGGKVTYLPEEEFWSEARKRIL